MVLVVRWFHLIKQLYYHGEPISVNVHVTNNSTKTVKRVKISGERLFSYDIGGVDLFQLVLYNLLLA